MSHLLSLTAQRWRLALWALSTTLSPLAMAQQQLLSSDAQTLENGSAIFLCNGEVNGTIAHGWSENSLFWDPTIGTSGGFRCGVSKITYSLAATVGSAGKAMLVDVASGPLQIHTGYDTAGGNLYNASIRLMSNSDVEVIVRARQLLGPYFDRDVRTVMLKANVWQTISLAVQQPTGIGAEPNTLMISVPDKKTGYKLWVDDASVTKTASDSALYRTNVVVAKSLFGIHQHGSQHHDTQPYNMGTAVGAERFWDTTVQLPALFPRDAAGTGGAWDKFEARIKTAQTKGTDLIMVLGGSMPAWAASDPSGQYGRNGGCDLYGGWDASGGTTAGSSSPPKDLATWRAMVNTLVAKAAGRIKYWEIWNEPYQCPLLTSGTPVTVDATGLRYDTSYLVQMAKEAYTSVKASKSFWGISHNLQVISPSFNSANASALDRYLALGGGKYQDITALHNYCEEAYSDLIHSANPTGDALAPPETCMAKWTIVRNVRNVLKKYVNANGVNLAGLPVWDTESRVSLPLSQISIAPQYVARHYLMSYLTGVDRSYYYTWDNNEAIALSTRNANGTYTQNAVGKAYQVASGWLAGATIKAVPPMTSGQMVVVIRPAGASVDGYLVWTPSGATTRWTVPANMTKMINLSGVSTAVTPGSQINVDGSMVFVRR